jgi:hypothetical protein
VKRLAAAALVAAASLAFVSRAEAHRLDELLQATRIGIDANGIDLEVAVSPGIDVAAAVIAAIDTGRDGRISEAEAGAYAASVVRSLRLSIDGRPIALRVVRHEAPAIDQVRQGVGTIRFVARADVDGGAGRRHLVYDNRFQPSGSVYLVNALTPSTTRVRLGTPMRDPQQRTFAVDYDVAGATMAIGWAAVAVVLIAVLLVGRRVPRFARERR